MQSSNRGWWCRAQFVSALYSVDVIEIEEDNLTMDTLDPRELVSALHHNTIPRRQWLVHQGKLLLVIPECWGVPDSWVCTKSVRLPAPCGKGLLTVGDLIREGLARQCNSNEK